MSSSIIGSYQLRQRVALASDTAVNDWTRAPYVAQRRIKASSKALVETIPDHLAMDLEGLIGLLEGIEGGRVRVLSRDLTGPSPLAQEVLSARPYAFFDDAPLEERRTQAVVARRWLDPSSASELARLDPHPVLLTPVLQILHRVISGFLIKQAGLKRNQADTGAVTRYVALGIAVPVSESITPVTGYALTATRPENP